MYQLTLQIVSTSPMLMHSDKLADPLNPATKAHKKLTSDRTFKATDDGKIAIGKSEYINSFYLDSKGKICLPALNIRKSLIQGARLSKGGKEVERGVVFLQDMVPLEYDGPRTPQKLWKNFDFVDCRTVVVSRSRVPRYRPLFTEWEVSVDLVFNPEVIDLVNIKTYFEAAGTMIGIGDFRPLFGRYAVKFP